MHVLAWLKQPFNDITTDLDDPPRFEAVVASRPAHANSVVYGGAAVAARQRERHPGIGPLETARPPADAFARALATAKAMGWNIAAADAGTGVIEAVATTPVLRFKDDVVVRVRANGQGSRVDLRSLSRVGRSDFGKNAARIADFMRRFAND